MREHLFKGFHPDENSKTTITFEGIPYRGYWVEGNHVFGGENHYIVIRNGLSNQYIEVIPETVSEYTGLADKNHKRIFEGHTCTNGQNTYEVVFEKYQFAVKVIKTPLYLIQKEDIFPLWQFDNCERNGFRQLEIVGDIHNTSETEGV